MYPPPFPNKKTKKTGTDRWCEWANIMANRGASAQSAGWKSFGRDGPSEMLMRKLVKVSPLGIVELSAISTEQRKGKLL